MSWNKPVINRDSFWADIANICTMSPVYRDPSNGPVDPKIEVWETEYPVLIVWGTHDPDMAFVHSYDFYMDVVGELPEDLREILKEATEWWIDPAVEDLVDDEEWPDEMQSRKHVEGWVPVLTAVM